MKDFFNDLTAAEMDAALATVELDQSWSDPESVREELLVEELKKYVGAVIHPLVRAEVAQVMSLRPRASDELVLDLVLAHVVEKLQFTGTLPKEFILLTPGSVGLRAMAELELARASGARKAAPAADVAVV